MSETGDMWREYKAGRRDAKAQNRAHGADQLQLHNVHFTTHNDGAHLRVEDIDGEFLDYWPGTGKWKSRKGVEYRGIKSLLQYLGADCG